MTASEKKWLAKTSDIVVDQFEGHNDEDLSTALAALASGSSIIEKTIPRQVIVVNPDIAVTDEIEGKLYRTYDAAYEYTHESPDTDFEIQLPAGEISGRLKVDNNLILQGSHTLIEGIDSYCYYEIDSTYGPADVDVHGGIIRNCVLQGGDGPSSQTNIIRVDYGSPVVTHQAYIIFNNCTIYGTDFDIDGDVSRPAAKLIFTHCDLYWDDDLGYIIDPGPSEHNPCNIIIESCTVKPGTGSDNPAILQVGYMDTLNIRNSAFEYQTTLLLDNIWPDGEIVVENSTFETLQVKFTNMHPQLDALARVRFSNCLFGTTTVSNQSNETMNRPAWFNNCSWRRQDENVRSLKPILVGPNTTVWLLGSTACLGVTDDASAASCGDVRVAGGSCLTMTSSGTGNCYATVYVDASSYFDPSQVGNGPVFGGTVTRADLPVRYATDASGTGMSATDTGQAYVGLMLVDGRDQNTAASYTWIQRGSGGGGSATTEKAGRVVTVNTSLVSSDTSRLVFNSYTAAKTFVESDPTHSYTIVLDSISDTGIALAMPNRSDIIVDCNGAYIFSITYTASGIVTGAQRIDNPVPSTSSDTVLTIENCAELNLDNALSATSAQLDTSIVVRNSGVYCEDTGTNLMCPTIFENCRFFTYGSYDGRISVGVLGGTPNYKVKFMNCEFTRCIFSTRNDEAGFIFEGCVLTNCKADSIYTDSYTGNIALDVFRSTWNGLETGTVVHTDNKPVNKETIRFHHCIVTDAYLPPATNPGSDRQSTHIRLYNTYLTLAEIPAQSTAEGEIVAYSHSYIEGSFTTPSTTAVNVQDDTTWVDRSAFTSGVPSPAITCAYADDPSGTNIDYNFDSGQAYVGFKYMGSGEGRVSPQSYKWVKRSNPVTVYSLENGNLFYSQIASLGSYTYDSKTWVTHTVSGGQAPSTTNLVAYYQWGWMPSTATSATASINKSVYSFCKVLSPGTYTLTIKSYWVELTATTSATLNLGVAAYVPPSYGTTWSMASPTKFASGTVSSTYGTITTSTITMTDLQISKLSPVLFNFAQDTGSWGTTGKAMQCRKVELTALKTA